MELLYYIHPAHQLRDALVDIGRAALVAVAIIAVVVVAWMALKK